MADSPREVFDKLLSGIVDRDFADLWQLYAPDTVVTQPYTLPEPTTLSGQDTLRKHFSNAAPPFTMRAENVVVRDTTDPEVIVAEYDYVITNPATNKSITTANVIIMRVRDGQIVESHDYHNHAAFAQLTAD